MNGRVQVFGRRVDRRPGGRQRDAGLEEGQHAEASHVRVPDGGPDFDGAVAEAEWSGQNTDDGVIAVVDTDRFPRNQGVGAEFADKERVADQCDAIALGFREDASDFGLRAEQFEDGRRREGSGEALDLVLGCKRAIESAVDGGLFEHVLRGVFAIDRGGQAQPLDAQLREVVPDHDQAHGVRIGEGTEQDGVHHAEDRAVGADAEGQRQNGGDRKAGGS